MYLKHQDIISIDLGLIFFPQNTQFLKLVALLVIKTENLNISLK